MNMHKQSRSRVLLLPALFVAVTACDGGGDTPAGPAADTPQPGLLALRVTGASSPAYGYFVEVSGPGITAVQPVATGETYVSRSGDGELTAAIVLSTAADRRILEIEVPDVNRIAAYSAVVRQATDSQNDPVDPSSYRIVFER